MIVQNCRPAQNYGYNRVPVVYRWHDPNPTVPMTRLALFAACFWFLLNSALPLHALTVVPRDLDQLVSRADTVFKGEVIRSESLWLGAGETRHIATRVTFRVAETYKGGVAAEQTLEFVGGTVGGATMQIPGVPRFEVGQSAVLFVVGNGKQFCPLVGVHQGRFHVRKDEATGQERVYTDEGYPVVDPAELGQVDDKGTPRLSRFAGTGTPAITAETFKAGILARVAASTR